MNPILFGYSLVATLVIVALVLDRREGKKRERDLQARAKDADFLESKLGKMERQVTQLEDIAGHYEPIPREFPRPYDEDPDESGIRWRPVRRAHSSVDGGVD